MQHNQKRRPVERLLVEYYHQQLLANHIQGYSLEKCWDDYRLALGHNLIWQVYWWSLGVFSERIWHNVLDAIEDMKTNELLMP